MSSSTRSCPPGVSAAMARARYSEWWSDVGTVFAHRDDRTAVLAALFPDFTIEVFPERHNSTRRTASSPSAWPTRCSDSGTGRSD